MKERDGFDRLFERATGWTDGSVLLGTSGEVAATADRSFRSSRILEAARTVERWVRNSYLYRWLTAEPDPEVVVIDLRDTYTVGPFLAAFDAVLEFVVEVEQNSTAYRGFETAAEAVLDAPIRMAGLGVLGAAVVSLPLQFVLGTITGATVVVTFVIAGLATIATRIDVPWSRLRETRAVRMLAAAFEPPPAPEQFESTTSGASDGSEAPDAGASSPGEPTEDEPTEDEPQEDEPQEDDPAGGDEAAPPRAESGE